MKKEAEPRTITNDMCIQVLRGEEELRWQGMFKYNLWVSISPVWVKYRRADICKLKIFQEETRPLKFSASGLYCVKWWQEFSLNKTREMGRTVISCFPASETSQPLPVDRNVKTKSTSSACEYTVIVIIPAVLLLRYLQKREWEIYQ